VRAAKAHAAHVSFWGHFAPAASSDWGVSISASWGTSQGSKANRIRQLRAPAQRLRGWLWREPVEGETSDRSGPRRADRALHVHGGSGPLAGQCPASLGGHSCSLRLEESLDCPGRVRCRLPASPANGRRDPPHPVGRWEAAGVNKEPKPNVLQARPGSPQALEPGVRTTS